MLQRTLNLGILAHVDAGKTTLTERLLFEAGAISEVGSVDAGTTQTDTLLLERQRGITIKAAVASLSIGDLAVNLVDTPGHPDFIAEVDRVLDVLDGAILVISAVEGVQSHSRILCRALQRLELPTLVFVNKVDRRGADADDAVRAIASRLTDAIAPMGELAHPGTRDAVFRRWGAEETGGIVDSIAHVDASVLDAFVEADGTLSGEWLGERLAALTSSGRLHPVFFGSALTGCGVADLLAGVAELLRVQRGDPVAQVAGKVFKIERGARGEKVSYVRMRSGSIQVRDEVQLSCGYRNKVTAVRTFTPSGLTWRRSLDAGEIGLVFGLRNARIGDDLGEEAARPSSLHFTPPTLESIVVPRRREDRILLGTALAQLAEQDPLINAHVDASTQQISVSMYGEVQKEVIGSTIARDYGIEIEFAETSTIFVERPSSSGRAVELLFAGSNPFNATVGLVLEPAEPGSGVSYRTHPSIMGLMPPAYFRAVEESVRETLCQGLHGWAVIDCVVTMTHAGFLGKHGLGHQYFNKSLSSTGDDFRKLTPLVTMSALSRAGTVVHEPIHWFRLDIPEASRDVVSALLKSLRGITQGHGSSESTCRLLGTIPAGGVHGLQQRLPDLTRGEGVAETGFDHYRAVTGAPPTRERIGPDPLDRVEYLKLHKVRVTP